MKFFFLGVNEKKETAFSRSARTNDICIDCNTRWQGGIIKEGSNEYKECVRVCGEPQDSSTMVINLNVAAQLTNLILMLIN